MNVGGCVCVFIASRLQFTHIPSGVDEHLAVRRIGSIIQHTRLSRVKDAFIPRYQTFWKTNRNTVIIVITEQALIHNSMRNEALNQIFNKICFLRVTSIGQKRVRGRPATTGKLNLYVHSCRPSVYRNGHVMTSANEFYKIKRFWKTLQRQWQTLQFNKQGEMFVPCAGKTHFSIASSVWKKWIWICGELHYGKSCDVISDQPKGILCSGIFFIILTPL